MDVYSQGSLTFIITPDKIIIVTSIGQQFYLNPKAHYWTRRIKLIKTMIQLGEIRDLNELSTWCASGQIEWVPTSHKYQLEKAGAMV